MDFLWDLFHKIYDVESLVRVGGLAGLTAIVFVETGLLVGFFLPGDSLLVPAGLFAARGERVFVDSRDAAMRESTSARWPGPSATKAGSEAPTGCCGTSWGCGSWKAAGNGLGTSFLIGAVGFCFK